MNDSALAVKPQPETDSAIEKASQTKMALTTTILDRENLQFFANMIEHANLIPMEKGGPPDYRVLPIEVRKSRVMAKICAGVAHEFDPISSQQNLDIIDGKIGLNARGLEVKLARTGRYSTRIEYLNNDGCKLAVLERSAEGKWNKIGEVEFTRAMAEAAGLTGKKGDMYQKYGPDMFYARCITRVCKRYAPETMDTAGVAYNLAKQAAAEVDTVPAKQIEQGGAPAAEAAPVDREHVDQPYTDPAAESVVDAELTETEDDPVERASGAFANWTTPAVSPSPADTDAGAEASAAEAEEAIDAEAVDPDESRLIDLRTAIEDLIVQKVGGLAGDRKKFLKGKDLNNEDEATLRGLLNELEAMP